LADNKKYYYLKLKENFFESDTMIVLESMPDGYLYSTVYIKLLCKSDYFNRTERAIRPIIKITNIDICGYISTILRMKYEDIKKSLEVLEKSGLVRFNNGLVIVKDINIDEKRNRTTKQYKEWRKAVFERDNYTCVICGSKNVKLNAHHKKPWAEYKNERFDINNGITLCVKCHKKIHKKKVK